MRHVIAGLMACAGLAACAQAQPPAPAAPAAPKAVAIADVEPDVTQQVSALLGRVGQGAPMLDQLTDNARAALAGPQLQAMGAALRPCGTAPALELLRRSTKGEDRQYVYRVACGGTALLVDIDFNKAAKINRLVVRRE